MFYVCLVKSGIISEITKEKAKEVRKQLDDAGLAVWSLGSPYGKFGMGDGFDEHL